MKFLIFSLLVILLSISSDKSYAIVDVIHVGIKAELIQKSNKVNVDYLIIESSPVYQDKDTESSTKGYVLEHSHLIKGNLNRSIYDYSETQSAMNVNEQISKSVIDSDFKILFTCSGNDCGDVVGWSLLLSSLIMGDLQKQSFSVAKKDNNDGSSEYIAFYVTEIDHQPRALIDLVVAPVNHKFDLLVDSKQVSKNLMKDGRVVLSGLNFKLGSSQLPTDGDHVIKTMSQIILENPKKRFAIVGHTDSTGNYSHNIKLSKHRASAVRSELIIKYGVDSKQIIADGVGPLTPLTYNSDEVGRSANRRVELVQL